MLSLYKVAIVSASSLEFSAMEKGNIADNFGAFIPHYSARFIVEHSDFAFICVQKFCLNNSDLIEKESLSIFAVSMVSKKVIEKSTKEINGIFYNFHEVLLMATFSENGCTRNKNLRCDFSV